MATVYISPTGSDARTYAQAQSSATPWLTVGKANTSATTGDTIIVMAGTHTMESITFTKTFTIQGETSNPLLYVFNAGGVTRSWTFSGYSPTLKYLKFTGTVFQTFVFATPTGTTTTINSCIFKYPLNDNGPSSYTANMRFTGNLTEGGGTNNLTANLFDATSVAGTGCLPFVSTLDTPALMNLTNNTFYVNGLSTAFGYGILYSPDSSGGSQGTPTWTLKNNIFMSQTSMTNGSVGGAGTRTSSYSCAYNLPSSNLPGTGGITSDPLFVDAANGNFNLRPTSPCIETGTLI